MDARVLLLFQNFYALYELSEFALVYGFIKTLQHAILLLFY